MDKTFKIFITTFLSFILIFSNNFDFPTLNNGRTLNKVYAANLKVNIPLNFTPTQSIMNPSKPILYFTDIVGKKVYSINYQTGETKSIQFDLPTERITFANEEIYVTLLKSGHQYYNPSTDTGTGAVAIIDANNFTLKDKFDVNIDPFDIAVDNQGYIYLFGGSNQWTAAKSYSRETKAEVASINGVRMQSYIQFNPNQDKLYTITTDTSPRDMTAYETRSGKYTVGGYDSPYHGDYAMSTKFRISPDGKYIFNAAGTIFKATGSKYDDMTYVTSLSTDFSDVAFNIEENKFYTAVKDNKIIEYDYTNFNQLKAYSTLGAVDSLFLQNSNLIAVSKDSSNKYFIENVSLAYPQPVSEVDNPFNQNKDTIAAAAYDSGRNKVYALDKTLNNLLVMDAETNQLEKTIKLSYKPSAVVVSEDYSKLYIVNEDENYLASEYDLSNFSNTRNLSYKANRNVDLISGHRHIYEKNGRLYIIDGEWSPKLLVFDANSFNQIQYSPSIEEVGDIAFSQDGKYMYKWQQYGWSAGFAGSNVFKYSIDGDKLNEIAESNIGYPNLNRDPLDTPVIVLEEQGKIVYKDKVFNLNNLTELKRIFTEPIYAVDEKNNLAVGKTKIYNLETGEAVRLMPNHSTNTMFFDKSNRLHFFNGKNMYSLDPSVPIGRFETPISIPQDKGEGIPVDFPIIIKYNSKIDLVNENNIAISDGKSNYGIKALISGDMLVIAHEALPYTSNITLVVGEDAVSSLDGSKFNDKFTLSFNTGKEYNRMAGLNRYETSTKVSQEWPSSKYAVLASGQDFPDALSSAPLAKKYNAPILLTDPINLDAKTEAEITRLGVNEIFIIGGYASVSKEIEDKVALRGIKVTRLQGDNRYKTALAVANYLGAKGEIVIAAGSNFPDALSIASYAAAQEMPIILVEKDKFPEELQKYISDYNISRTYVIGGPGVISDGLLDKLPGSERIYGNDRYETNLKVLNKFQFYFGTTFIASGRGFADALSASALAGMSQSPIVLADESLVSSDEAMYELKNLRGKMKMKYTVGGEGSVPTYVIDRIFK